MGPQHLESLLKHALKHVPKKEVPNTPIFLLATGGMRLVDEARRKALLSEICSYARESTGFQLPDCDLHVQVISGETEGLYGWVAANYLLQGFDDNRQHKHGKNHHTFGFVDMGGASAQIAFAPNATEAKKHADDLTLLRMRSIDGRAQEYKVFLSTWLGFGVNEARKRYVNNLFISMGDEVRELPDPCLPEGLALSRIGTILDKKAIHKLEEPHLIGTGDFRACLRQSYPLLAEDVPCEDTPCLLHGDHVPAIDFSINHFVGVSEYWHMTHKIFGTGYKDESYDFETYQARVNEFCGQEWQEIVKGVQEKRWGKKVHEDDVRQVCFKASWIINMLHNGIGIPRIGVETPVEHVADGNHGNKSIIDSAKENTFLNPFQAVKEIHGTEVSWTLGKMVLYASSQIPPAEDALAVGFGTNQPGIPSDFQFAGGSHLPLVGDPASVDDWEEAFSDWSVSGVLSGLLLFILILAFASFCYCSSYSYSLSSCRRTRRETCRQHLSSKFRRNSKQSRSRTLANRFFLFTNGNSAGYERAGAYSPTTSDYHDNSSSSNDVELGSRSSTGKADYYDHPDYFNVEPAMAKSSGWATPQINTVENSRPQMSSNYFDSWLAQNGAKDGAFGQSQGPNKNVGLGVSLEISPSDPEPLPLPSMTQSTNRVFGGSMGSFSGADNGGGGNAMDRAGLMARTESRERVPSVVMLPPPSSSVPLSSDKANTNHQQPRQSTLALPGIGAGGVVGTRSSLSHTPLLKASSLTSSLSSLSLTSLLQGGNQLVAGGGSIGISSGSRSRAASPSRLKSPLFSPLKENID